MERDLIVVVTKRGMVLKFAASDIPERRRGGAPLKLIKLPEGDEIVGVTNVVEVESET